jgi:hypothetical protein
LFIEKYLSTLQISFDKVNNDYLNKRFAERNMHISKKPIISIIQGSTAADISSLGFEATSSVQCEVDFESKKLKPLNCDKSPYDLQWFQINFPDDYILHYAVKVDWPYEGIRGFAIF